MQKIVGGIVLAAGVAGLGYWGAKDHAERMQSAIEERALGAVAGAIHDVTTEAIGRDIRVTGLADSIDERNALVAALNDVEGRRVVIDDLDVLPAADPFTLAATRKNGQTLLQGNVPSEAMRMALAESGVAGADGLTLASGAPERWESAIGAGLAVLSQMDEGSVALTGTKLRVTGLVETPAARDALIASLALPEGYSLENDIETRDDGMPLGFDVIYDAAKGVNVTGKLPNGLELMQIGDALGISGVEGEVTTGIDGDASDALAVLAKLKSWLPELSSMKFSVAEAGLSVSATSDAGVNAALVQSGIKGDLGDGVEISVSELKTAPQSGATRVNAATGQKERFEYGSWLPQISFSPALQSCATQSDKLLERSKINFLSGSTDLGPRSQRAINAMATVVGRCVREAGLIVELGGHTDNTGSGNYELSAARAQVVRDAMIARGVPGEAISAIGFGPSKPIASNATEEGRAANRRTTLRWAQQ